MWKLSQAGLNQFTGLVGLEQPLKVLRWARPPAFRIETRFEYLVDGIMPLVDVLFPAELEDLPMQDAEQPGAEL